MIKRRKIARKQVDALLDLLGRIENELPNGSLITVSEEGDEEVVALEEDLGVEVDDVDLVIDLAVLEFQESKILPKREKGTFSLSGVFEFVFGQESPIAELAIDLETVLSGYQDMIWNDEVESALDLIEEIRNLVEQETKDATPAQ